MSQNTSKGHIYNNFWANLEDGAAVYSSFEQQEPDVAIWNEVTDGATPAHVRVLYDTSPSDREILVATPPNPSSPFRLHLTMAQYCSLLCIWHCNINEGCMNECDMDAVSPEDYCEHLRDFVVRNNIVVSIPHLDLTFAMDSEDFSHVWRRGDAEAGDAPPVMSTLPLARAMGEYWKDLIYSNQLPECNAFARVRAQCFILRVASGAADSMKVCISAEAFEIRDLRQLITGKQNMNQTPELNTIERQVLSLPHGAFKAGACAQDVDGCFSGCRLHADFGIDEVYDHLLSFEEKNQPGLQVNIFMGE